MKSLQAGLIVRPFQVKIPTGGGRIGHSNGSTLNEDRARLNSSTERGYIAKKELAPSRAVCISIEPQVTAATGGSMPLRPKQFLDKRDALRQAQLQFHPRRRTGRGASTAVSLSW
jgi:hypothetical protein